MEQTLKWGSERRDSFGGDADTMWDSMGVRSQGDIPGSAESLDQGQGDHEVTTETVDFREKLNSTSNAS